MYRYIADSPGFSRPSWMDDEQYQEFRMTPEYAAEVSYVPDEDPYTGFEDEFGDYADAMAEAEDERLNEAAREAEEMPFEELEAAFEIFQEIIARRREEEGRS